MSRYRYAYLHGLGSSPRSHKGVALERAFVSRGFELARPDLNRPSFALLDHAAMLAAVDEMDALAPHGPPWRLVGSSLGGWLAARWAELRPERVDRLVLLCPGFDLADRWPEVVGAEQMARWQREGALALADASGAMVDVHWGFIESARRHPGTPEVPCRTLILHGVHDEIVPVEQSRRYAATRPHVRLIELDDDHALAATIDRVVEEVLREFEIPTPGDVADAEAHGRSPGARSGANG
ncbi:MAG TPA: YqiA/YcfP family alpha/beta fold hydrolase [Haliangium sp.]|nr:YqiA/YcfP family alpha/beta fold hydrolase [Haliangium sp.]